MFDKAKNMTKEMWWLIILSGAASIVFGLVALFWPVLTLATLVYIFAIFIVVGGAIGLFEALSNIKKDRLWWLAVVLALVNLGIGVFLIRNPLVAVGLFVVLAAIVIFTQALFDLIIASYAEKEEGKWLWLITGLLGLLAGLVVVFYPAAATLAFVWVLGLHALIHGIVAVAYAVQNRSSIKKLTRK